MLFYLRNQKMKNKNFKTTGRYYIRKDGGITVSIKKDVREYLNGYENKTKLLVEIEDNNLIISIL